MKTRRFFFGCIVALTLPLASQQARADGVPFTIGDIFAGTGGGTILHYSPTFTLLDTLTTGFSGFQTGMAFDVDLSLYATNFSNSNITKFTQNGNVALPNPFVTNDPGGANESIVFNMAGEFFVGQADSDDIIRLAADGTFIARYTLVTGPRGTDWIELAADQRTIYYTSEGNIIRRFDVSTNMQLPDFATLPGNEAAFQLRFLPTGDLLVAYSTRVLRLNAAGVVVQEYLPPGANTLFALNVEPNGTTFLTADLNVGTIYRIDILTGAILDTIEAGEVISGLAIAGELIIGGGGGMMGNALEVALPQREILLNMTRVATRDVNARLFRLRAGEPEARTEYMAPVSDGKEMVSRDRGGKNVLSGKDQKEVAATSEEPFRRFSFFADGDFGNSDQDDDFDDDEEDGGLVGFNGDTWAATLGAEYRVTRQFTLGLGVSYLNNHTDLNGGRADLNIEGFAISPYVSWANRNFYVDALYSYGFYNDEIRRHTLADTTVHADPDSTNHTFAFNLGYKFHFGQLVTGPFGALEYIRGNLDAYTESGTNGIVFDEQDYKSLLSKLGWQGSYRIKTSFGAVVPQLRASWERENLDDDGRVVAHFAAFDMSARAGRPGDDYMSVGGGVMVEIRDCFAFVADVENHFFREDRRDFFASIRTKVTF